jgi:hypothetical protein
MKAFPSPDPRQGHAYCPYAGIGLAVFVSAAGVSLIREKAGVFRSETVPF